MLVAAPSSPNFLASAVPRPRRGPDLIKNPTWRCTSTVRSSPTNPNAMDPLCHTVHAPPPYTRTAPDHPIQPLAEPTVRGSSLCTGSAFAGESKCLAWDHPHMAQRAGKTRIHRSRPIGRPARARGATRRGGGVAEIKRLYRFTQEGIALSFSKFGVEAAAQTASPSPPPVPKARVSLVSRQASFPSSVPDLGSCSRSYLWRSVRHAFCYIDLLSPSVFVT